MVNLIEIAKLNRNVCVCVYAYESHVCTCLQRPEDGFGSLEVELSTAVTHLILILGTKLGLFTESGSGCNH